MRQQAGRGRREELLRLHWGRVVPRGAVRAATDGGRVPDSQRILGAGSVQRAGPFRSLSLCRTHILQLLIRRLPPLGTGRRRSRSTFSRLNRDHRFAVFSAFRVQVQREGGAPAGARHHPRGTLQHCLAVGVHRRRREDVCVTARRECVRRERVALDALRANVVERQCCPCAAGVRVEEGKVARV